MWTRRQMQIVELLLKNAEGIFGSAIAAKIGVSDRTIRNDIKALNKDMARYCCKISASQKNGYYLENTDIPIIFSLINQCDSIQNQDDVINRQLTEIGILIFCGNKPIADLADELFVSQQTIYKDMTKMQKNFRQKLEEDLFLIHRDFVSVNNNEEIIRKAFLLLLKDESLRTHSLSNSNLPCLLVAAYDEELKGIAAIIKQRFEENSLILSDNSLFLIAWSVYFSIVRNRAGHALEEVMTTTKSDKKIIDILSEIETQIAHFFRNDIHFLDNFMWTLKLFDPNEEGANTNNGCLKIVNDFCAEVYLKYGFNLRQSEEIMDGLTAHVDYMLRRLQEGYEYENPLKRMVKDKFGFAYEVAMLIVPIVFHYQKKYLLDGEVSYVAIYVAYYLEKYHQNSKAVLVCHDYSGLVKLAENWIVQNFEGQIELTGIIQKHQLSNYLKEYPVDLVISLTELFQTEKAPVYVINDFPDYADRTRINQLLNQIRTGQKYESAAKQKFNPCLTIIYEHPTTFEKVIEALSQKLFEQGYIEDYAAFAKDVIQRESNYPTLISNWFMVPHPLMTFAKKSAVAVAILKKPIQYHNKDIQLIFLLGTEAKNDPDIGYLFQLFKFIGHNKDISARLMRCDSKEQFYDELISITRIMNQNHYSN